MILEFADRYNLTVTNYDNQVIFAKTSFTLNTKKIINMFITRKWLNEYGYEIDFKEQTLQSYLEEYLTGNALFDIEKDYEYFLSHQYYIDEIINADISKLDIHNNDYVMINSFAEYITCDFENKKYNYSACFDNDEKTIKYNYLLKNSKRFFELGISEDIKQNNCWDIYEWSFDAIVQLLKNN